MKVNSQSGKPYEKTETGACPPNGLFLKTPLFYQHYRPYARAIIDKRRAQTGQKDLMFFLLTE
jgi:hypothetical protein